MWQRSTHGISMAYIIDLKVPHKNGLESFSVNNINSDLIYDNEASKIVIASTVIVVLQ